MYKRVITLAFLNPRDDPDCVNKLTANVSAHPICHVKLVFNAGSVKALGFTIQLGEVATLRRTKLTNPGYKTISLSIPASNHDTILRFCQLTSANNLTFDNRGMYLAYFHPGACMHTPSQTIGATFCSKIICEALRAGEVKESLRLCPSSCTPSSLYAAFKDSPSQVISPVRMPSTFKM